MIAINKVVGVVKNLNLTKKDLLMIVGFLVVIGLVMTVNHYRNETVRLETVISTTEKQLEIERNDAKANNNVEKVKELEKEKVKTDKELVILYRELKELRDVKLTYTQIMEDFGEINNTEDVCNLYARYGHPICGKLEIIRKDQ